MIKGICNLVAAIAVSVAGLGIAAPTSAAVFKQVTCHETVVSYETRTVAYKKHVTRYDDCGQPYTACVTCCKTVKVPVEKTVAVTKWVKVRD